MKDLLIGEPQTFEFGERVSIVVNGIDAGGRPIGSLYVIHTRDGETRSLARVAELIAAVKDAMQFARENQIKLFKAPVRH